MINAHLINNTVKSNDPKAYSMAKENFFGERIGESIEYSLFEAMYLAETKKITILLRDKPLLMEDIDKKFSRIDKKFGIKYPVYKHLRKNGHIPKTALKFGAEFRVYEKGKGPGKGHSKWIVFCDSEKGQNSWHEFSAKNRVAHSTNKKLLLAIVDDEKDVLFYEVAWTKI